jgi:hypothetical protein
MLSIPPPTRCTLYPSFPPYFFFIDYRHLWQWLFFFLFISYSCMIPIYLLLFSKVFTLYFYRHCYHFSVHSLFFMSSSTFSCFSSTSFSCFWNSFFPVSYFAGRLHFFYFWSTRSFLLKCFYFFIHWLLFLFFIDCFYFKILVEGISVLSFCLFKMHAQSFLINITWPHNFLNKMHWNSFLFRTFFYSTQCLYT